MKKNNKKTSILFVIFIVLVSGGMIYIKKRNSLIYKTFKRPILCQGPLVSKLCKDLPNLYSKSLGAFENRSMITIFLDDHFYNEEAKKLKLSMPLTQNKSKALSFLLGPMCKQTTVDSKDRRPIAIYFKTSENEITSSFIIKDLKTAHKICHTEVSSKFNLTFELNIKIMQME